MTGAPDPDWYLDNVLIFARPGTSQLDVLPAAAWRAWWRGRVADCPAGAADRGFVLLTDQLATAGLTRSAYRWAVRTGRWTSAGVGAVGVVDVRDGDPFLQARRRHALRAAAAAHRRPGSVVSGRSAAVLHGLPTLDVPESVELTSATARQGRRSGRHAHGAALRPQDTTTWFGIPVTTVARTLVDLARHDRCDAIMAADAARRERLVEGTAVRRALADAAGWPGVQQARAVLALADPLAESALESLVRLALRDAGFPRPELQVRIRGYRVDLCWPELRIVVEVDGLAKYRGAEWAREKRREQRLRAAGYRVERVTWDDLRNDWPQVVVHLRSVFASASRP